MPAMTASALERFHNRLIARASRPHVAALIMIHTRAPVGVRQDAIWDPWPAVPTRLAFVAVAPSPADASGVDSIPLAGALVGPW
jgi:hypothetical protein